MSRNQNKTSPPSPSPPILKPLAIPPKRPVPTKSAMRNGYFLSRLPVNGLSHCYSISNIEHPYNLAPFASLFVQFRLAPTPLHSSRPAATAQSTVPPGLNQIPNTKSVLCGLSPARDRPSPPPSSLPPAPVVVFNLFARGIAGPGPRSVRVNWVDGVLILFAVVVCYV
ncbi:hypothetical protein GWI33_021438 [Rhynchophorus ferrugineus]|uniref:Uncharacterized protein n=1 Tax=Rhynchophorus ferrugineus TaxID=354439 RepID=A0A834M386_RHYFE|nr:hypothetical protein GWI33_021438 [Rhynchophorus ferrugineus]